MADISAARRKYLQLGQELEALPSSVARDNLLHTHSKLGIFMQQESRAAQKAIRRMVPYCPPFVQDEARALLEVSHG